MKAGDLSVNKDKLLKNSVKCRKNYKIFEKKILQISKNYLLILLYKQR